MFADQKGPEIAPYAVLPGLLMHMPLTLKHLHVGLPRPCVLVRLSQAVQVVACLGIMYEALP